MNEPLLNTKQLANFLQVSVETIRRYVRSGELECTKLGSRHMRFTRGQIDAFLASRSSINHPETDLETTGDIS